MTQALWADVVIPVITISVPDQLAVCESGYNSKLRPDPGGNASQLDTESTNVSESQARNPEVLFGPGLRETFGLGRRPLNIRGRRISTPCKRYWWPQCTL